MKLDEISDAELIESNESPIEPAAGLGEKYQTQMRQIFPQKIELPITALVQMIEDQIKLDPDFQRRGRWDTRRQSRLIESVIMNVPIPPVFLGEDDYGSYVVLDGRQRLTAVYEFLRNSYALEGLEVWKELNTLRFRDLEKKDHHKALTRRFIPAILLLKESSPEVKYDVFDRLNTGGVTANQMEIRNAIFQGPFNRLLHELSSNPAFMEMWDIPTGADKETNGLFSTMGDVQLVLRFMALREPAEIEGSFKWYLGHYMDRQNKASIKDPTLLEKDRASFLRATDAVRLVFGAEQAFVRPGTGNKSAPLADAVMIAFSQIDSSKLQPADVAGLQQAFAALDADADFKKSITSGTNGKGAITTRIEKARAVVAAAVPHACIN